MVGIDYAFSFDKIYEGGQHETHLCIPLRQGVARDWRDVPKFIDEPMIGLDPHAIKELKLIFEEIRSEGRSIFVSTHMIDSIDMLWDRTIILKKGKVCANVTREALDKSGATLEQLFFRVTESDISTSEKIDGNEECAK